MKTQKHKGVFFFFLNDKMQPSWRKKQKKTNQKKREKNGTVKMDEQEGGLRRPTGWYEVWRSMQKSTRKRELLQKCHRWASGWTPARLKRRGARGVFPARIRDPFESGTIQSEVPRLWKESLLHRPGLAGWYILFFFHTCTHSQFRDAQFVFSKFEATRGRRRLDLRRGIHRKLHRVKNAPAVTGVKLKVSPGFQ